MNALPTVSVPVTRLTLGFQSGQAARGLTAVGLLLCVACGMFSMPKLEEQRARIRNNDLAYHQITSQAFLDTWGKPTYQHRELTQFFPVENGAWVPRFRVPLGEPPEGWLSSVQAGPGHFLVYADRGELLGFLDDRLVYRETVSADQVMAIKKLWDREALFRSSLEMPSPPR